MPHLLGHAQGGGLELLYIWMTRAQCQLDVDREALKAYWWHAKMPHMMATWWNYYATIRNAGNESWEEMQSVQISRNCSEIGDDKELPALNFLMHDNNNTFLVVVQANVGEDKGEMVEALCIYGQRINAMTQRYKA